MGVGRGGGGQHLSFPREECRHHRGHDGKLPGATFLSTGGQLLIYTVFSPFNALRF